MTRFRFCLDDLYTYYTEPRKLKNLMIMIAGKYSPISDDILKDNISFYNKIINEENLKDNNGSMDKYKKTYRIRLSIRCKTILTGEKLSRNNSTLFLFLHKRLRKKSNIRNII